MDLQKNQTHSITISDILKITIQSLYIILQMHFRQKGFNLKTQMKVFGCIYFILFFTSNDNFFATKTEKRLNRIIKFRSTAFLYPLPIG